MNIQRKNSAHHFRMQSEREQTLDKWFPLHGEQALALSIPLSGIVLISCSFSCFFFLFFSTSEFASNNIARLIRDLS